MPANPAHPPIDTLGIADKDLHAANAYWTAREIVQQPAMLRETHALLATCADDLQAFIAPIVENPAARIVLTGAGTSSFIGECIAPLLDRELRARVDAVATTDIVSAPRLYLAPDQPLLLVSFGRSGNSPESIAAVELAENLVKDVRHFVFTCNAEGTLAHPAVAKAMTVLLPEPTHDRGFAMTSSFSCMMYAGLATLLGPRRFHPRVNAIADAMAAIIATYAETARALAAERHARVVYLGSHIFKGLARESALKLGELSNGAVATCFDSPMGFRHGPKTFITPDTLVVVFVSNDPLTRKYDLDLLEELRRDGRAARVLAITAQPVDGADVVQVPALAHAPDTELLWPYVSLAQMYAFHASLALGLTPDNPNPAGMVNRVVQGVRLHGLAA